MAKSSKKTKSASKVTAKKTKAAASKSTEKPVHIKVTGDELIENQLVEVEHIEATKQIPTNEAEDFVMPDTTESLSHPTSESAAVKSPLHNVAKTPRGTTSLQKQPLWVRVASISIGVLALLTIIMAGVLGQFYKGKTLPNVVVAGVDNGTKSSAELKTQLKNKFDTLQIKINTEGKVLTPKKEEIGMALDVDSTLAKALDAKRYEGFFTKIAFWKKSYVPAVVRVNDTLLEQYVETNSPSLNKPATDAQLQFDSDQQIFIVSDQSDGQGPDVKKLKQELLATGGSLTSKVFKVSASNKKPAITEAKLKPLLLPANELITKNVVLSGLGYSYKARASDIASWVTPTPQPDGSIKLVVDPAKVQSYIEGISKKIASIPQDRKIIKDETSGAEVVIQEGRSGTELADKQALASAIALAVQNKEDTTQTMKITTAAFKTVNMNAYDKWIEVDLSEQRTTAYEKANPIRSFIISSGMKGHETVTGEFAIWLRVRTQTMSGGSRADGSYYSLPNVEWISYFYQDYALHGAYWRKQFGTPQSHGCVNMTNDDAHWVYDWAPLGTKVIVHI